MTEPEKLRPDPALLSACIHCGLCLPACPTYLATGREVESPRGRIHLLNSWVSGALPLTRRLAEHIDSCLGCLGCQTACPSGVQYERILNQARPHLAPLRPSRSRRLWRFVFSRVLPDYGRLRALGKLLRLWQSSGGKALLRRLPFFRRWQEHLMRWQDFLPPVAEHRPLPRQSWSPGDKAGKVELFAGCVMDIFYNHVNHACLRLLTAQRQIVSVPEQTCCGALAFHAGEIDIARDLARRNIEHFQGREGTVVATAAGCGAMLKGYGELLDGDPDWRQRAAELAARVEDITEFLSKRSFSRPPKAIKRKAAYHAACHLAHAQGVRQAPARLLGAVPGLTLVRLEEAEHCCGSAGIFNLTHTDLSLAVLERKVGFLAASGADVVVTTNPGCLLQMQAGLDKAGLTLPVVHLAELLDEAYSPD